MSLADVSKMAYVGSQPESRDSNAWYTPAWYVELARAVLGGIGLDPFSSSKANEVVKADRYYDEQIDAFTQDWRVKEGGVFMNPPYSSPICGKACSFFVRRYKEHRFKQGIVLVNNATETRWGQSLLYEATAVSFPKGRIAFWNEDGKAVSGNTRGQMFVYFGPDRRGFMRAFSGLGAYYWRPDGK